MKKKLILIISIILIVCIAMGFTIYHFSKPSTINKSKDYIVLDDYIEYIDSIYFSWINYPDCKVEKNMDLFDNDRVINEFLDLFGITPDLEFNPEKYEKIEYDATEKPYRQVDGKILVPFKEKGGNHYYIGLKLKKGKIIEIEDKNIYNYNDDNSNDSDTTTD